MKFALLLLALGTSACGGGSSSAPAPAEPSGPNPSSVTITITPNGVSPQTVAIAPGGRVTFVNNDTQTHNMLSDPHPEHDDCPELGLIGFLTPGQSRTSANLNTPRICGFHDHDNFANARLRGSIVIQ